jgi:NAD kinase
MNLISFDVNKHCGDGTILRAATWLGLQVFLFLGINAGRLDFVTVQKRKYRYFYN